MMRSLAAKTQAFARAVCAVALLVPYMAGCSQGVDVQNNSFDANPITAESLEGLILEGEGPIPARLIYRSRNSLSSEEDRLVLEAISQELDRLMELAGQLDEAIIGETEATVQLTPTED